MTRLIAIDIGGTHARFAEAEVADGRVTRLGEPVTLRTAEQDSFQSAWRAYTALSGKSPPRAVAISAAGPVGGEVVRFTNNDWTIRPAELTRQLDVDAFILINDFEAVGHAVAEADDEYFLHLCGPDRPLPATGTISIVGPGTGLGVGQLWRSAKATHVQATEGGHISFAPRDAVDDAILGLLRIRYDYVSAERVVSGPGLAAIHEALAAIEGRKVEPLDDKALWSLALSEKTGPAAAALDHFCRTLGSVAGDIALAQGGSAVVIAGGLGLRIGARLVGSAFVEGFTAKGRFEAYMAALPVKLITHPEPGLLGAAAAFARRT